MTVSDTAREALEGNFIAIEEIEQFMGLPYDDDCYHNLEGKNIKGTQFLRMRASGYFLIPGPPCSLAISDMFDMEPNWFHQPDHPWYATQDFYTQAEARCQWIAISGRTLDKFKGKTFNTQRELLVSDELFPTAAELVWAMIVLAEVRKTRFLYNKYMRTFSRKDDGQIIDCGRSDRGISIRAYLPNRGLPNIGVVPKLRLAA